MKSGFSIPGLLWALLVAVCIFVILTGLRKVLHKTSWTNSKQLKIYIGTLISFTVWIALLAILSTDGFFADFNKLPPRPVFAILIPLPVILAVTFSQSGKTLLELTPPHWLVMGQSFRILVELLIWLAFLGNKLPVQMTFEGNNFDVFSGLLALPVGYMLWKRKRLSVAVAIAFNVIGILLLLNILVIAMLSMPTVLRYFMNEPSSGIVASFPFILLPGVLVPLAYSFHIFSLRQLLTKSFREHQGHSKKFDP